MYSVRTVTLCFVLIVVVVLLLPGVAVADTSTASMAVDDEGASPGSVDENATDQLLVFFESADRTDGVTSTTGLQSHAADTQAEFLAVADRTDGLDVVTEFWITSAVLVEVNGSAVDVERVATDTGAVAVHENEKLELDATSARSAHTSDVSDGIGTDPANAGPTSPIRDADGRSSTITAADDRSTVTTSASRTTYGLDMIDAPRAWSNYGTTGEDATVAVLDSGVEPGHPDIDLYTDDPTDPTYPGGWAEFDEEGNEVVGSTPFDSGDHGTHVSGTVAGGNVSGTHVGVAPDVRLIHGKVTEGQSGTIAGAFAGMQWAMDNDADVVTMSLGSESTTVWIDPVETLADAGIVVVASSGNFGDGTSLSPGNLYSVIGAGAVDADRTVASFSSGEEIDTDETWGSHAPSAWPDAYVVPTVTAPGVGVNSTVPSGYDYKDGTSMAAPHVAGSIALMQSASPEATDLSPNEIRSVLRTTATERPSDPDTRYGAGIVNAFGAAMYVNDDGEVAGTVTDDIGDPIENATVEAGTVTTTTDENGQYELLTDAGETDLTVSAFGYETRTVTADVTRGQSTTRNVVAPSAFDVETVDEWPTTVTAGESVSTTVRVANLESASISVDSSSTTAIDRLDPTIDGESTPFGEVRTYDRLRSETFTVRVDTANSSVGTVTLETELSGLDENRTVAETVSVTSVQPAIAIADQTSDGGSVVVGASYHETESTIGIYRDDEGEIGDRLGTSESLSANVTHENVFVDLSEPISENTTVHAVILENDSAVTVSDEPVRDTATVTVHADEPLQHPSGVSQELFDAVDQDGTGQLARGDIRNMIREYAQFGAVDGVPIDRTDVRSLIRWYALQ